MKAFIIALQGNAHSQALAARALETSLANGYEARLHRAYTPETGRRLLRRHRIVAVREGMVPHFEWHRRWTRSGGMLGCFASHYSLWLKCAERDEDLIILEHDARVLRPWPAPKWRDVLHLNWEGSLVRRKMGWAANDLHSPLRRNRVFRAGFVPRELPGFVCMNCTYAYAIHPHAAARLILDAKEVGWFAPDRQIREPIVAIQTLHPAIAEEQEGALYSTTVT
jgi:hypothetical protein